MGDENPQGFGKKEIVDGEEDNEDDDLEFECGEGEGPEGEQVIFEASPESQASLLSDFCKEEQLEEEEYGEEWACVEMETAGEQYEEGFMGFGEYEGEKEKEPELPLEEKRSLDSEYLKAVLGTPLTYALLDIATRRPTDPIQYLGHYLLKWRWCGENKEKYEKSVKELTEQRTAHLEKIRDEERKEMLLKEQELEAERRAEKVESSIEDDDDDVDEFGEFNMAEAN